MPNTLYLSCKDHTVSGEKFELIYDDMYDMLITQPVPSADTLPEYYKSEDYISHTDSKKTLIDRLYQRVKQYNLNKKIGYLNKTNPEKGKLLDIGAGTGDFIVAAQKKGWEVHGTEPNKKARFLAKEKGVSVSEELLVQDKRYDVITMWHVLEHVPNVKEHIKSLSELLDENGTLFIAVPNFKSYDAKHYKEHWAAYDVPRHLFHFSRKSINKLFNEENMVVVKILPMIFDAFYVSMLSEKYKKSKFSFIRGILTGMLSNIKANSSGEYSSLIYIIKKAR